MKAIILAGEELEDKCFKEGKALVPFKDKPLIEYSIDALRDSGLIDHILVVGKKEKLSPVIHHKVDKIVEQENNMLDNLIKGISYVEGEERILVSTCDIPLVTSASIRDFINHTAGLQGDVFYPIIERSICQGKYPDAKRTYASLKEGDFTGGNMIIVNPDKIKSVEAYIRLLIKHRKNPLKMTKVLGFPIVVQMLSKNLSIKKIEAYIKERWDIEGRAFITAYPELASDIDRREDIAILEKYI